MWSPRGVLEFEDRVVAAEGLAIEGVAPELDDSANPRLPDVAVLPREGPRPIQNALGGDTTCFRLAVRIRPGMVFLAFVAVLHMIFGALAAHNGNTAVAERVAAETDLPVKRRSSLPEAAEEVKEDDKEAEKTGFSMWESISRSVTPPAPSGTESPIHVKIEE